MMVENISKIKKYGNNNYYIRKKGMTSTDFLCLLTFTKTPQECMLNKDEIELILSSLELASEWIRKHTGLDVNIIKERV